MRQNSSPHSKKTKDTSAMSIKLPIPETAAGQQITDHQKSYLDGFLSGISAKGTSFADVDPTGGPAPQKEPKKTKEEKIKDSLHPFDAYSELRRKAKANIAPEPEDIFRFKWNGLFWLAPVHEGYMCRLRIPGGQITSTQWRELASISDDIASSYGQITTRNNIQLRVIQPKDTPELLHRLQEVGLHSRGTGADNLRNFTANPTAGIDPYEIIDVSPHIKDLAYYVTNNTEFYNLPRKFNISFDGGGLVGVAEDTNDIGMRAIRLTEPPKDHRFAGKVKEGIYFRILLGGITGHEAFAEDSGIICHESEAVDIAMAMTRVYIRNGNRGNRGKSRLIYLLKDWGIDKFITETEKLLGQDLIRFTQSDETLVIPQDRPNIPHPQIGVYPQKQRDLNYIGVYVPVGMLSSDEMRIIADLSETYGTGDLRLTIWQNIIIPNIPTEKLEEAKKAITAAGLKFQASPIRGGVAACTGSQYCKFANADTKKNSIDLVTYLEEKVTLDQPINIHTTGCPHSCAQHYIGDIGLLACKVQQGEEIVEGYHIFVGGGFGQNKNLGRQLHKSIAVGNPLNQTIETLLKSYLNHRKENEPFQKFTQRHTTDELINLASLI
jgi:ferredoxin-nitrite reductase